MQLNFSDIYNQLHQSMRTTTLAALLFMLASANCFSQLRVRSNGTVKIGTGTGWPDVGRLQVSDNATTESRVYAAGPYAARIIAMNSIFAYGFGIDASGNGQIWKDSFNPLPIMSWNSSGSFGINYTPTTSFKFFVGGNALAAGGIWQNSDERLKNDIKPVHNSIDKLLELKAYSYVFNNKDWNLINPDSTPKRSYGFLAQEMSLVLPELVHVENDSNSTCAINYIGLIPLLVNALNEQELRIRELESQLNNGRTSTTLDEVAASRNGNSGRLEQNRPNPFNKNTLIDIWLSANVRSAELEIYDMKGVKKFYFPIGQRGYSSILIEANNFEPGSYVYSLTVDGICIESRQLIVTP